MSIYFTDMLDVLRSAGCEVAENDITAGWQTRSRSSGGFPAPPLGIWMHHTASRTAIDNDLTWQIRSCPERPVGNVTLDRHGVWWPIAAGASNCAGRGGPWQFSRGECGRDRGNVLGFQIEACNGGTGEPWPVQQINSYLQGVNALNRHFGNAVHDVVTHHAYAPTRKIDPATADAVQGSWQPHSYNRSGTWSLDSIYAELDARAGAPAPTPGPQPPPTGDDDMASVIKGDRSDSYYAWNGVSIGGIPSLEWVQWGVEAGLYRNSDPIIYPQGFIDQLVEAQGER